ncbi:MAG: HmuY family protein [Pseudomonadota bacterium]
MNARFLLLFPLALAACGDKKDDTQNPGETGDTDTVPQSLCPDPAEIACEDDLFQDLLTDDGDITDGAVDTTTDGDDFVTAVDAQAGGMNQAANNPWVYLHFDRNGARRVDISDEDSVESMDWHMGIRRFYVRLNGGDAGPSCVGVAKQNGQDYADIGAVPEGTTYQLEDFYTDACELTMDNYGMSPRFAMYGWWDYTSCVVTTELPYLIQLDTGEIIKLRIETYYGEGQQACNDSGTLGSDSGVLTLRWRFME